MDVAVISVLCTMALAAAALIALRWGGLRPDQPPHLDLDSPPLSADSLLRFLRVVALGILAGAIAAPLVLGIGGRLVMRILAATSGDRAQGALTEAEERVGEITADGTIGFVVFIGIFVGVMGAFVYLIVRHWLPEPAWVRGLFVGVLGLGFARLDPLNPDNVDFAILEPDWLAVLLLGVLPLFYGATLASLVERFDRAYPTLAWRPRPVVAHLPLIVVLLARPPPLQWSWAERWPRSRPEHRP